MSYWKPLVLSAIAAAAFLPGRVAPSQISVGIGLGGAPVCPYGYFDYAPYDCAPYGYYGPDWFVGGVFLGAGPWFHGPRGFHGHVDNRFDPHNGYHGPLPPRGAQQFNHFRRAMKQAASTRCRGSMAAAGTRVVGIRGRLTGSDDCVVRDGPLWCSGAGRLRLGVSGRRCRCRRGRWRWCGPPG